MYQMIISGKTLEELNKNIQAFVKSQHTVDVVEPDTTPEEEPVTGKASTDLRPLAAYWPDETKKDQAPSTTSDVDSAGRPWDERIHSATKAVNADGTWRNRRGVDKELLKKVEAEFVQPAVSTTTPPANVTVTLPQVVVASTPMTKIKLEMPVAEAAPVVQTPPPLPQAAPSAFDFESFTAHLPVIASKLSAEGKITRDYILQLEQHYKLPQFMDILKSEHVDARLQVFNSWAQYGLIQKVG